jgi:hypothetical protein
MRELNDESSILLRQREELNETRYLVLLTQLAVGFSCCIVPPMVATIFVLYAVLVSLYYTYLEKKYCIKATNFIEHLLRSNCPREKVFDYIIQFEVGAWVPSQDSLELFLILHQ